MTFPVGGGTGSNLEACAGFPAAGKCRADRGECCEVTGGGNGPTGVRGKQRQFPGIPQTLTNVVQTCGRYRVVGVKFGVRAGYPEDRCGGRRRAVFWCSCKNGGGL